jgi:hypothetical protein
MNGLQKNGNLKNVWTMHRNNKHTSSLRKNNVIMLRRQKSKQKTCSCCASNFLNQQVLPISFSPFLDMFITSRRFFTLACDRTVEMNGKIYAKWSCQTFFGGEEQLEHFHKNKSV